MLTIVPVFLSLDTQYRKIKVGEKTFHSRLEVVKSIWTWAICTRRARKFYKARSPLYRSQILQENIRWKALAEIYTMHSFAPFSNLNCFVKKLPKSLLNFAKIIAEIRNFSKISEKFRQISGKILEKNVILERCKGVHCVDLGESFPTYIFLQNLASIQPRTSPLNGSPRTDPPSDFF